MKKKKGRKKVVGIVIAAVVLVVIFAVIRGLGNISSEIIQNDGTQVQPYANHDLSTSINVSGTVESQNVLVVTTDLTYKVKQLNVSLGDYVKEGDVLCVFDDSQIRDLISELEAQASETEKLSAKQNEIAKRNLTQAENNRTSEVAQATDAVNKVQNEYNNAVNRYNTLRDRQSEEAEVAYAEMKSLENSFNEAKNNLEAVKRAADEAVQAAQDSVDINSISGNSNNEITKQLSELYRQLEEVNVVAGQSGIITTLNISQGSIPNGVLMKIEDNSNLKIKVSIKEKDILKISQGMAAKITADAIPDSEYEGQLSKVINFATSGSGTMETMGLSDSSGGYSAEVQINGETSLLLGMSAKVEIVINEYGEALSVPYDSIAEDDRGSYVYRAVKKSEDEYSIERVDVTVGVESDYYTAVTSDKLTEGDLIVNYPDGVTEGESVKVNIHEAEKK